MFLCDKCGLFTAKYDFIKKSFICTNENCKREVLISPQLTKCLECNKDFQYYTWFDPSRCPHCSKSFVE